MRDCKYRFTRFYELACAGIEPPKAIGESSSDQCDYGSGFTVFFKEGAVSRDEESGGYEEEIEGLHPLGSMDCKPVPGMRANLLCNFVGPSL